MKRSKTFMLSVSDLTPLAKELHRLTIDFQYKVILEKLIQHPKDKNKKNHMIRLFEALKANGFPELTVPTFSALYSRAFMFVFLRECLNGRFYLYEQRPYLKKMLANIPLSNPVAGELLRSMIREEIPRPLLKNLMSLSRRLRSFVIIGDSLDITRVLGLFYESFLKTCAPQLRKSNGVYFTALPIVSFIVRSIHRLLENTFNKPFGIASRDIGLLDPGSGTGVFIETAVNLAINTMTQKHGEEIKNDFTKNYMLNQCFGFEKMFIPYFLNYLQMVSRFTDQGICLESQQDFHIYFTNTLSLSIDRNVKSILTGKFPVILGNPPYSIKSANKDSRISKEIKDYYLIDNNPLEEKNLRGLQDDYVKFIRFAQLLVENRGEGIIAFVTSHSYLHNLSFRGMRYSLQKSFDEIYILNLHGNHQKNEKCPDGSKDENVFDMRQGACISLFIKKKKQEETCRVFHADLWGLRENKFLQLRKNDITTIQWKNICPEPTSYRFTPTVKRKFDLYQYFYKVTDIFPVYSAGIVTGRDKLTIRKTGSEMYTTVLNFSRLDAEQARRQFNLGEDTRDWQVKMAQQDLLKSGLDQKKILPILYRPFDIRYTYYTGNSRGFLCMPRYAIMRHLLKKNFCLITTRQVSGKKFSHSLASDTIVESRINKSSVGISYVFPLYVYPSPQKQDKFNNRIAMRQWQEIQEARSFQLPGYPNINPDIFNLLVEKAGLDPAAAPEQIFYYVYAVLFSNIYRETYTESLTIDFPRIPFTEDYDLFNQVSRLGKGLLNVHLLKSPELQDTFSTFDKTGENRVQRSKIRFFTPAEILKPGQLPDTKGNFYINETQYFSNISRELWDYVLCGYHVLYKWLKSRNGLNLTPGDISHFITIARALQLTIRYQYEIDRLYKEIENHLL
jgi:predicted helicase